MVDPDAARSLRALLEVRTVAALGTLHRGDPAVSMVPFILPASETRLFIHVSALATHTPDMQKHPRVSLLEMAEPGAAASPRALPRVTLQGLMPRRCRALARTTPRHGLPISVASPNAEETFELGDFSIMALQPVSARLVAGFGGAYSLVGDPLIDWLRQ